MPNTIKTNTLAELVAVRFAEAAAFLTVGSSKYFAGQLVGKRNGQTYKFVVRDTGEAVNALAISGGDKTTIVEREISLTLDPFHVAVETNAIESVTDLNWDKEIAQPNSQKLVNAVTKKAVRNALGHAMTAFVGEGFLPKTSSNTSLIPYNLREAFGLTTVRHKMAVYAYYFYRLIQRARHITFVYNESNKVSRFIERFFKRQRKDYDHDKEIRNRTDDRYRDRNGNTADRDRDSADRDRNTVRNSANTERDSAERNSANSAERDSADSAK